MDEKTLSTAVLVVGIVVLVDSLSKPFLVATWVKQEDSAELAEQAGLWRRTRIGDLYS